MISMRAMGLENDIEKEIERFQRLKQKLDGVVKPDVLAEDKVAWLYGEMKDFGGDIGECRDDDDVDKYEQTETVRTTLLELLDSVYTLEGLLYTRGVLMN